MQRCVRKAWSRATSNDPSAVISSHTVHRPFKARNHAIRTVVRMGEAIESQVRTMTATATVTGARVITDLPPSARSRWHVDHMVTNRIEVGGRTVSYASGGRGLPVLFLHGWGLDHRAYQRSLRRLTARGCRVIAPSMPGFGGTSALPLAERNIKGYAAWVGAFIEASGWPTRWSCSGTASAGAWPPSSPTITPIAPATWWWSTRWATRGCSSAT